MRRFVATCSIFAVTLALACEDAPLEVPPDKGGPGQALGTGSDTGAGDTGDGDGEPSGFVFSQPLITEVSSFNDLQLADLDGDGCADLALAAAGSPPRVDMYPSACDGHFDSPTTHDLNAYERFVLADLDGDARADLLARAIGEPPRVEVYLASAGFGDAIASEIDGYDQLWAIDLDGDGRAELLGHDAGVVPAMIDSWTGPGDGSLVAMAAAEVGSFDAAVVGCVDGDGFGDLVTGLGSVPVVNPWLGLGDGTLASAELVWPHEFDQLELADLDGDGRAELLTDVPGNDWRVSIYANTGESFAAAPQDLAAVSYTRLRSADVDGDGDDDIVLVPTGQPPRVMVWLSAAG